MATKVTLQIDGTDANGKKTSEKISYVNPEATDNQLKQFAQQLMALTTTTRTGLKKTTEEDIL